MSIFGKNVAEYVKFAKTGMILIVLMGLTRFFVGISGVPYERATHLVSMSNLTLLLFAIFGHKVAAKGFGTYRHLLPTAAVLSVSMYGFIILAILTEGSTGLPGYFHYHSLHNLGGRLPPQLMGLINVPALMNVPTHIAGQVVAGILFGFVGWGMASLGFLLSRYLGFLRNAFLLLAGLGVFRLLLGAIGVPQAIGTWISSVTLLTLILAVYYGWSASSHGFHRYWQIIPIGFCLSVVLNLVVIAGMLIASNFMLANYFNPAGVSINGHIAGHLLGAIVGTIPLALLVGIGFVPARRREHMRVMATTLTMILAFGGMAYSQSWQPPSDNQRCPSKWGAGDQRGSGNHMSRETVLRATKLIRTGEVFELGHVLNDSMPLSAGRRFEVLTKRTRYDAGSNHRGSNEELVVAEIGQVGTQFDTFSHQMIGNSMYNCFKIDDISTRSGFTKLGVDQVGALMTRAVMIDVAALKGVDMLPPTYEITVQDLQQALATEKLTLQAGDAVIIHTGWGKLWGKDNERFRQSAPGIGTAAAEWLARQDPMLVGSDNSAIEVAPNPNPQLAGPVHQIMLVVNGIHLLENMKLDEIAARRVYEFALILEPLKIQGGTGSTVAPVAIH